MTYNTKNTAIVFAFAAVLLAWPMTVSTAHAVGGDGVIDAACSIVLPTDIDLGAFTPGAVPTQAKVSIVTDGTIPGTFEIQMDDNWDGVGTKAVGSIIIIGESDGVTVTVNQHTFTGTSGSTVAEDFDSDGTFATQAIALAAAINISAQTVVEDVGADIGVTAFASENAVLITATAIGVASDSITVTSDDETKVDIITATLGGGAAIAEHLLAEDVRFAVVTDGTGAPADTYSSKAGLGASGVNTVITTESDPNNNIDIYFQFNGVDDKATGVITLLAGLVNGDTITVGGTVFTAEATLADVDASNNEFFTTEGTPADDAITLAAAINAVPNTPDVTAGSGGDDVTVTAKRGGASAGNDIVFTEVGGGVTLVPADNSLDGGKDALSNLPYSGVITSTMTFTADCDT